MYIEAKALVKQFGLRTIVNNMDVSIQANEIIAIIGPNGAGKSTMLEMLIGLQKPSSGTIWYWDSGFGENWRSASSGSFFSGSECDGKLTVVCLLL